MSFNNNRFSPDKDRDAFLVLLISFLVIAVTGGISLLISVFLVIYKSRSEASDCNPDKAIFLVFGKQLIANKPDAEYRTRLNRLATSNFHSAIIMGGITAGACISESQAGLEYLRNKALNGRTIQLEQQSQNTLENLKNTRRLLNDQQAIIISNRYHLARCAVLASSLNIKHLLCPAENDNRYDRLFLYRCLLEAFYIHWFYSGKSWALLTRNQRILARIT